MMYTIAGKVMYSPERKGLKAHQNKNVIIIDLAGYDELAAYYRRLFHKHFHVELLEPLFDLHVTIIKNKEINDAAWGYKDGEDVEITLSETPMLYWNEKYVWIDGETEILKEIAAHYGVPKSYNMAHITIGRFKDHEKGILGVSKR